MLSLVPVCRNANFCKHSPTLIWCHPWPLCFMVGQVLSSSIGIFVGVLLLLLHLSEGVPSPLSWEPHIYFSDLDFVVRRYGFQLQRIPCRNTLQKRPSNGLVGRCMARLRYDDPQVWAVADVRRFHRVRVGLEAPSKGVAGAVADSKLSVARTLGPPHAPTIG